MVRPSPLYFRWSLEMRRSELFPPGKRVGIAVSGGPDSVLLLEFMKQFARQRGLTLAVVHFNHHLRGEESDSDQWFVEELAREAGIEFIQGEAQVRQTARERRRGIEETARDLRYRYFFSLVNQGRVDTVATAHTANDQAETVLLRLVRGTGTRGLGGIFPMLEAGVVRPFLSLTRQEVQSEIETRKLNYRLDPTNSDTRFVRNKIRLELLPWLTKELNPGVVRLLKGLADRAREEERYLEMQARERASPWRTRSGQEERIPVRALANLHPALERRVLRQMISSVRGNLKGVTHTHIEALRHFAVQAQSGRRLVLPHLIAKKEFGWLVLGSPVSAESPHFCCPMLVPGRVSIPQVGLTFYTKIVTSEELQKAYNTPAASGLLTPAGLDPLKLSAGLVLRSWRAGDRFQPWGSQKPAKLKELFRQHRVAVEARALWPVLESGREIVWVRGFPPARSAAVARSAERAVIIVEEPYSESGEL